MLHCRDCRAWFEPRATFADLVKAAFPPKKRWGVRSARVRGVALCLRCEAMWTILSLKSEALCDGQRALPFPLFPQRSKRSRRVDAWPPKSRSAKARGI
jgi:hypothetical protein